MDIILYCVVCRDPVVTQMRTGKYQTTNLLLVHELVLGLSEQSTRANGMVLSLSSGLTSESQIQHNLKHSRMKAQCYGIDDSNGSNLALLHTGLGSFRIALMYSQNSNRNLGFPIKNRPWDSQSDVRFRHFLSGSALRPHTNQESCLMGNINVAIRQHSVSDSGTQILVLSISDTVCLECVSTLTVAVCRHWVSPTITSLELHCCRLICHINVDTVF